MVGPTVPSEVSLVSKPCQVRRDSANPFLVCLQRHPADNVRRISKEIRFACLLLLHVLSIVTVVRDAAEKSDIEDDLLAGTFQWEERLTNAGENPMKPLKHDYAVELTRVSDQRQGYRE